MKEELKKLYEEAVNGRNKSYSPYSKFKVGASVLLDDGNIINGANIENSSYGLCMCAERNALYRCILEGYKKENIVSIMVLADCDRPCSPCGACRQVMAELMNLDCPVYLTNLQEDLLETTVKDLLPYSFEMEDMKNAK